MTKAIILFIAIICNTHSTDEYSLRSLMRSVENKINEEYKLTISLSFDDCNIFASDKATEEKGISINGLRIIELWAYRFTIEVKINVNHTIEDAWVVMYKDKRWLYVKYDRKSSEKLPGNDYWTTKHEPINNGKLNRDEVKMIINKIVGYKNFRDSMGMHSLLVGEMAQSKIMNPDERKQLIDDINSSGKKIFTDNNNDDIPFFNIEIYKISESIIMAVVSRGFPLAGPIDGYWFIDDEIVKMDPLGIK